MFCNGVTNWSYQSKLCICRDLGKNKIHISVRFKNIDFMWAVNLQICTTHHTIKQMFIQHKHDCFIYFIMCLTWSTEYKLFGSRLVCERTAKFQPPTVTRTEQFDPNYIKMFQDASVRLWRSVFIRSFL